MQRLNILRNTFTYDPSGNRLKLETLSEDITTSVYNAANQLLTAESFSGITTYSYDLAGNRRSVETPTSEITSYTFDALNHNIAVEMPTNELVTYTWAPVNKANDERQIQRDDGLDVIRYLWDDQVILLETDDTNIVLAQNTAQPGGYGNILSRTQDTETSFYQFDGIGSTRSLSDATGTPTDEYTYEAFGKPLAQTGSTENPYTWIGEQGYRQDEATGEYNLRARDYAPQAARFTSEDPLGLAAGDSNFYRYVTNDPINKTDPSGLDESARVMVSTTRLRDGKKIVEVVGAKNPSLNGDVGTLSPSVIIPQVIRSVPTELGERQDRCALYSQIEAAVRSGSVTNANEWDAWFARNGSECGSTIGIAFGRDYDGKLPNSPTTCPAGSSWAPVPCQPQPKPQLPITWEANILPLCDKGCGEKTADTSVSCASVAAKVLLLSQKYQFEFTYAVYQATGPEGKVSHILDPMDRLLDDMLKLVHDAQKCGLMSAETADMATSTLQSMKEIVQELRAILPENAIQVALDLVQVLLGILGLIPVIGEIADIIDIIVSAARRDALGCLLGLTSLIPLVSTATGAIVIGARKIPNLISSLTALGAKAGPLLLKIRQLATKIKNGIKNGIMNCGNAMQDALDNAIAKLDEILGNMKLRPAYEGGFPSNGPTFQPEYPGGPRANSTGTPSGNSGNTPNSGGGNTQGGGSDPNIPQPLPSGLIKAAAEARQKVKPGGLKDFSPPQGSGRSAGHARSSHGFKDVNDPTILDIRNNPDRIYVGVNDDENKVVIFWKDDTVVITDAADTTSVITAYGKNAPGRTNNPSSPRSDIWACKKNYFRVN